MTNQDEMSTTLVDGQLADYAISVKNCNSIDDARISLRRSALNIKFGPNGIGKSTIARALVSHSRGDGSLTELLPFKYRSDGDHPGPTVEGADDIQKVLVFDESYVSQFVFQRDEVLKNSFEIFINTDEYKQGLDEIQSMFQQLKGTFSQAEFEEAVADFTDLRDAFGVTNSGGIAKTSRGFKALGMGGKLKNIPEPLKGYEGFLQSDNPAGWITWQAKGKEFLNLSDNCPFCSTSSVDKETAKKVSEEYESAAVKNMTAIRSVIDRLGGYFEPSYLVRLNALTTSIVDLSPEGSQFLAGLRGQIEIFLSKLTSLRGLSFHALQDADDIDYVLRSLKIDLSLLDGLNSEGTRLVVDLINEKIDEVAAQINEIRRRIGVQKTRIARLIKENQDGINDFLSSAGYQYSVLIELNGESYRMILQHNDSPGHLETASQHLSYGEKNAFALVLFMHHVRWDKPDLVVLDDPVSSFDKTKKFAILHQLFHGKESIRGFTSLLLTHDIEPAIDIVRTATSQQFSAARPVVHFLSGRSGVVSEKPIEGSDISTFSEICDSNIESSTDDAIKCIYLRRRFEVHGNRGLEYDLLSSLLHLREVPARKGEEGNLLPLDAEEVAAATRIIETYIPDFDYSRIVGELRNPVALRLKFETTSVGYEKLQLFRILSELDPDGMKSESSIKKFVNESFHIENEYVMQLNPREFDTVPQYVIEACSALVSKVVAV